MAQLNRRVVRTLLKTATLGLAHSRSASTFNQKSGVGERNCEIPLDAHSVGLRDVLKVQDRTDEQLLTALQDAARCAYASGSSR